MSCTGVMTALFFTQTLLSLSVCLFVLRGVPFAFRHYGVPYWTDETRASSFFFARSPPLVASINTAVRAKDDIIISGTQMYSVLQLVTCALARPLSRRLSRRAVILLSRRRRENRG